MNDENETKKELYGALAKAQAEMKSAAFDSSAAITSNRAYRYASLAAVKEAARGPLAKHGLGITQLAAVWQEGIVLETRLFHESGQSISSFYPIKPEKDTPQGFGSALTYARRYCLSAILNMVTDEDDDGAEASRQNKADKKEKHVKLPEKPEGLAWSDWILKKIEESDTKKQIDYLHKLLEHPEVSMHDKMKGGIVDLLNKKEGELQLTTIIEAEREN